MNSTAIQRIEEQLRRLPPGKLAVASDFVTYLAERERRVEPLETALAAEAVLARDWSRSEEDGAWRDF
jgi:hypothetical protein